MKQIEDISLYPDLQYAICLIKPSVCLWHVYHPEDGLQSVGEGVELVEDLSKELLFRIRKSIDVNCLLKNRDETIVNELDITTSVSSKLAFLFDDIRTIVFDDDNGDVIPSLTGTDIINELKKTNDLKAWPSNKTLGNVINVTAVERITSTLSNKQNNTESIDSEVNGFESGCNVPVLLSKRVCGECAQVTMKVDALVLVPAKTSTRRLLYMFRDAVFRQCNAMNLLARLGKQNCLYEPFHFSPSVNSLFPITTFLPMLDMKGVQVTEDSSKDYRRMLHQRFLLADDRPSFRLALSSFSERVFSNFHLINPHEGLPTPDIEGGVVAMVHGKYAYHHYMQDGFDDNIWGCAYRSLQTLCSWFWFQGYSEKKYPSHLEIQEALVAMGDKEKHFIGSKEWIGSLEVSYCLDHIYDVTSKTIHISTGSDMAHKGREIYQHFVDQGTPIMIGGGVLAHSIVGVVYNEHTGDVRFLIVDPHFTGSDVLKTVQSKGWVAWKGPDFWNQTAHYNMCMPQRPKGL